MCALVTGVQTCALPILTGALDRIDIRGSGGLRLKDCWSDGPTTFLGLQSRGFPNFFTLVGPHNGSTFCNVGVCGGLQAEWVARMIAYMTDHGLTFSQPLAEVEEAWTEEERKRVVEGKSVSVRVDLGGRRIIQKKKYKKRK